LEALGLSATVAVSPSHAEVDHAALAAQAAAALHRAVAFYREQVATEGSYLWKDSADLTARRGEGPASPSPGWVQPPGTPASGQAYLAGWQATGDEYILAAAVEAAHALVATQLVSGRLVPLDRRARRQHARRRDHPERAGIPDRRRPRARRHRCRGRRGRASSSMSRCWPAMSRRCAVIPRPGPAWSAED
jgi:hypothetical protein